ncbi:hypothetical protein [Streptomyces sp. CAI-85]|uniref:hypothetical protein n=1 Tax=Streptomyces sp. CAI-85 TaxID=1472662 RepID=UPI001587C042|nr:hypothetical protein [Streptomyces sp. CAI-85]NUV60474.1 hypothetical protein [Streptomyces sp. CAI-85]
MALFNKKSRTVDSLIREANAAFANFSADSEYVENVLKPVLPKLYAAVKMRDFTSTDQLEAVAAPLKTLPPLDAALCAASVLHAAGRLLAADPLGESLANFVAIAGTAAAWKAVPLVKEPRDVRRLIDALNVLWRYEPSPYREVDHAQAVYAGGHLALALGLDHDALTSRWREALRLLSEVDPALGRSPQERETIARTRQHLEREWSEQLASLSAGE